jgi:FMN phosphatase YigB (HAD superfamily)
MNNQKVFVFDFDQTLIMGHSFGQPDVSEIHLFGNTDHVNKLNEMLQNLFNKNIPVYVNTRGEASFIKKFLDYHTNPGLIKDVYGATSPEAIADPFLDEKLFYETDKKVCELLKKLNVTDLKDSSSRVWSFQKVCYLDKICKKENVPKENVYFFDDTLINILYARENGYKNSFRIFDETFLEDAELLTIQSKFLDYTLLIVNHLIN